MAFLRILRYKGYLYLFLKLRLKLLVSGKFLASHLLHVGILLVHEDILCLGNAVKAVDILLAKLHDVLKVLVLLCKFDITLLVSNNRRVGYEG